MKQKTKRLTLKQFKQELKYAILELPVINRNGNYFIEGNKVWNLIEDLKFSADKRGFTEKQK